jgi:hypothetical protein
MLADGNGETLDCALAAQELLERALSEEEAGALLREVGNFDFDAALVRVRIRNFFRGASGIFSRFITA